VVGRMAGEMDDYFCSKIPNREGLVVIEEMVESIFQLTGRHAVLRPERLLDLGDSLADTDGRLRILSVAICISLRQGVFDSVVATASIDDNYDNSIESRLNSRSPTL
jgi:hypothetical protein